MSEFPPTARPLTLEDVQKIIGALTLSSTKYDARMRGYGSNWRSGIPATLGRSLDVNADGHLT